MDIQDSNSLPDDTGDASSNPRGNDDSFFIFSPLTLAATAGHSADSDQNSQNSQNSEMATEGQGYLILQANEASEEVDNGASANASRGKWRKWRKFESSCWACQMGCL